MSTKGHINTTIQKELLIELKKLAAEKEKRINKLLEEAIRDLLLKYDKMEK